MFNQSLLQSPNGSTMDSEDDGFMRNASGIDIPIICLDDDDNNLKIDKDYKLFLDHFRVDNNLGPLFQTSVDCIRYEVDDSEGESETRKFDICNKNAPGVGRKKEAESNKRVTQQRKTLELKAKISTAREKMERDKRVAERRIRKKIVEFEAARRDNNNNVSQGRKRTLSEIKSEAIRKAVPSTIRTEGTSRDVPVEAEVENVQETSRKKGVCVETSVVKVDKDYMSYLTWLVDTLKESATTKPVEKDLLVKVKEEVVGVEPWSDNSDIIAVSDYPFTDGEVTPFVASKRAIDLEEESKDEESGSCLFRKELMEALKKPYDEKELELLSNEVSKKRLVTRCRELRKGRQNNYETEEWGPSYLELYSDFNEEYKLVKSGDKAKALELLRGFFFYLVNVCRDDAFRPWVKNI